MVLNIMYRNSEDGIEYYVNDSHNIDKKYIVVQVCNHINKNIYSVVTFKLTENVGFSKHKIKKDKNQIELL